MAVRTIGSQGKDEDSQDGLRDAQREHEDECHFEWVDGRMRRIGGLSRL